MVEDFLAARAGIAPEHPALIYRDRSWTYAQLDAQVAAVCARLEKHGVGPGDRVGVLLPNIPLYVVLFHALIRMSAVIVPLNLRWTPGELEDLAGQASLDWLVRDGEPGAARKAPQRAARPGAGRPPAGSNPSGGWFPQGKTIPAAALEMTPDSGWRTRRIDTGKDWGVLFTSGTSGSPRGAVLTLDNLHASAVASGYRLGTLPWDRWLLVMPLYHIGGLSIVFRCCLYGTTVVLHDGFDPHSVRESMDKDAVTLVSLVPTMLRRLLDAASGRRLPDSVRLVLLGGAKAGAGLLEEASGLDLQVALTYGLTEAASQVATALPGWVRRYPGSVGMPLKGTSLRIANPMDGGGPGDELPRGETGEIYVAGPTVMRGYLGEAPVDGWLRTGDIGYIDEAGGLTVLQRRTDLILSGGENVYPAEVERVLEAHEGVEAACVIGLPDETWGQRVAAAVVPAGAAPDEDALAAYLRKHLAGYKLPRQFLFVSELPCTASGKVCRPDVQALFEEEFGESGRGA